MSTILAIETLDHKVAYEPGEPIDGIVSWSFDGEARDLELRLLWYTSGKGDRDSAAHDIVRFEGPELTDAQPFSFTAPRGPYSFSGKLITLTWALELVVNKDKTAFARQEIVIAPGGREVSPGRRHEGPTDEAGT